MAEAKIAEGKATQTRPVQEMAAAVGAELELLGNYITTHPLRVRKDWEELIELWLDAAKAVRKLQGKVFQLRLPLPGGDGKEAE